MTDSTTIDPGKAQARKRRATDKPRAASTRAGFNPIHPSMELPPEQLIRLLGLEKKKPRKSRRPAGKPASAPGKKTERKHSLPAELLPNPDAPASSTPAPRASHRQREYEQASKLQPSNGNGLWKTALAAGLILGVGASAYLFWMPSNTPGNGKALANIKAEVKRPQTPAAAKTQAAPVQPANGRDDPAWLATVAAQEQRLREEAGKRLEEKMKQGAVLVMPVNAKKAAQPEAAEPSRAEQAPPVSGETEAVTVTPDSPDNSSVTGSTVATPEPTLHQFNKPVEAALEEAVTPPPVSDHLTTDVSELTPAAELQGSELAPVGLPTDSSLLADNVEPPAELPTDTNTDDAAVTSVPLSSEPSAAPAVEDTHDAPAPAATDISTANDTDITGEPAIETPADTPASEEDLLLDHSGLGIDVAE